MRLAESTASNMNLHLRERWHSFCHSQFVADLKVALVVWSVIVWLDGVDIPVFVVEFGAPIGLPAPKSGVGYVVSTITAQAAARAGRTTVDLFTPDGTPVRDANGQIIGVHALAKAGA